MLQKYLMRISTALRFAGNRVPGRLMPSQSTSPAGDAAPSGSPASAPASIGITQLTGDVTAGPGSGAQAAMITAKAVTNAKLTQMAANTLKGNNTGATANPSDLSATEATAMLNAMVGDFGLGRHQGARSGARRGRRRSWQIPEGQWCVGRPPNRSHRSDGTGWGDWRGGSDGTGWGDWRGGSDGTGWGDWRGGSDGTGGSPPERPDRRDRPEQRALPSLPATSWPDPARARCRRRSPPEP